MNPLLGFRRIILPQAFRIALPPMTNDFVSLFKDTSVAYAISVWELATAYRELANASGQFLLLGVADFRLLLWGGLPHARVARQAERSLQNKNGTAGGDGDKRRRRHLTTVRFCGCLFFATQR